MNLFEAVKQAVTARRAAGHYGLSAKRSGKVTYSFHKDRTSSMKVNKRFHCFGCRADDDVIDCVAKLYGIDAKEAAEKLAEDFQLSYDYGTEKAKTKPFTERKIRSKCTGIGKKNSIVCCQTTSILLRQWKGIYAPKPEDEAWYPLFVKTLQRKMHIECLLDVLLYEPIEERAALIKKYGKEVMKFEQQLSEFGTGAEGSPSNDVGELALSNSRGSQRTFGADR